MRYTALDIEPGHGGMLTVYTGRSPEPLRHRHREVEFNLVTAGTGAYLVGRERWLLKPNSLIWLFPDEAHHLVERPPELELWVAACRSAFLEKLYHQHPAARPVAPDAAGARICQLDAMDARKLAALLSEAAEAKEAGEVDVFNAVLGHAVVRAWSLTCRSAGGSRRERVHPAILRAIGLIEEDPEGGDLPSYAKRVGLSRAHFIRLFKSQTGMSFSEYRNRVRLERFFSLHSVQPRRTLLELAMEAGFGSYLHFYRVFQKVLGTSPRTYFT